MDTQQPPARDPAAGLLADLDLLDTARVRALRDECRVEERRLSYVRRMVQGHLDLAAAEVERRAPVGGDLPGAGAGRPADGWAATARALTGPAGTSRSERAVGLYEPATADVTELAVGAATARLPELDDAALRTHVDRLHRRERALSDRRAVLLGHLDRLQAALVERYRDGRAVVDDVAPVAEPG